MATYRVKATSDTYETQYKTNFKSRLVVKQTFTLSTKDKDFALIKASALARIWSYVQVTTNRGADHLIRYQDGKVTYNAP